MNIAIFWDVTPSSKEVCTDVGRNTTSTFRRDVYVDGGIATLQDVY
jgi:hypothetical protein